MYVCIYIHMCQSLPEITGDGACVCARNARVSVFECTRVWTSYSAYEHWNTGGGLRTNEH